jgi:flagellar motor component MotA
MKPNMGTIDRVIRLVLAAGLIAGGFFVQGAAAIVLWALGAVMVLTATIAFCPLYLPFKISTAKK